MMFNDVSQGVKASFPDMPGKDEEKDGSNQTPVE